MSFLPNVSLKLVAFHAMLLATLHFLPDVSVCAYDFSTLTSLAEEAVAGASQINPRVAGGVESTATDFGRFMDMLLNGGVERVSGTRVLNQASVDEMLSRQTSDSQSVAFIAH